MKLQVIVMPVADVDRAKPPANRCVYEIAWRSLVVTLVDESANPPISTLGYTTALS
ncbi:MULTISPECIES: hypothetical protein [unclassified Bradyrhizobium]|uniref:hypothetical protein n=1 Tax=unclassified Bradyrhizobium TaxID=2631580 RepID=UPI002FEF0495